ncbi:MAG: transglycosylase SLT domain-containing protein [Paludibacter sp.]|nr:transglycosylase SLT domain-containing protein [Paludibacter sp.]
MRSKYTLIVLFFSCLYFVSCVQKDKENNAEIVSTDLSNILVADTLRVATMYGPTSYFLYRDETMGYDYELAQNFAKQLNVNLKISIAKSEAEMIQMLQERKVDIVSYNFIETKDLKRFFNFVLPQSESYQVLVQNVGSKALSSVTELAGKTVYVTPNSVFKQRMEALNNEIGGTINIVDAADSLTNNDLIEMVSEKKIDYTVTYRNLGLLHKYYSKNLNCRLAIGFNQHNGWLVRSGSVFLTKSLQLWATSPETENLQARLREKYWEKSPYFSMRKVKIPKGAISPYDHLFKKYASLIDWDWHLLAAVAFHESRFDSDEVSWAGASGLMQLMPRTAANFGLDKKSILNPERNIEAGVQYIKSLNLTFRKIENKDERIKFILAGYNSGPAHIIDAIELAKKYGKNPNVWFNNVEYFLLKKSEPEFYNDPVVKYGSFGGKETVRYVQNTLETYEKYLSKK